MKEVKVEYGQTLVDIAIQELGDASRAFELAVLNNVNVSDDITPGSLVKVPDVSIDKTSIAKVFNNPALKPASGIAITEEEEGIEFWTIEDDFVVS